MDTGIKIKNKAKLSAPRKIIGDKMKDSIANSPQGTLFKKMNMEPILAAKEELKKTNPEITITGLTLKALSKTLEKHPDFNSTVESGEIVYYDSVNIGVIAEAKNGGLYIVVVKDTQDKNVIEISKELKEILGRLNSGKITMDDISGATFSLSNLGMFDVDYFTPLIMPPQVGILGIAGTNKDVVVNEKDEIVIQRRTAFSLTVNHVTIDGAPATRFLSTLREYVENPSIIIE